MTGADRHPPPFRGEDVCPVRQSSNMISFALCQLTDMFVPIQDRDHGAISPGLSLSRSSSLRHGMAQPRPTIPAAQTESDRP